MLSDAERMFWAQKAERMRTGYLNKMGDPKHYEKFCEVVVARMDGKLKVFRKVKQGKITYEWQKQRTN